MAVHDYEMFHGIVLTKLARSDRPITLRMIETRPEEAWSLYTINDAVELFIKHSTAPRPVTKAKGAKSWTFTFGPDQLSQMQRLCRSNRLHIALVGGGRDIKDIMQVCLLHTDECERLIDMTSAKTQSVTVRYEPRKRLRVFKERRPEIKVPQNRLDTWAVPGS